MTRIVKVIGVVFVISLIILTGCSRSEEETLVSVKDSAEEVFEQEPFKSNQTFDNFSLYIPKGYKVEEESKSNLILKKDGQTYILFYNALEDTTSELNFKAAEANGNFQLLQSFQSDERFGFVKVVKLEEEYELQIGIGGMKITTQTTLKKMEKDTREMMQIGNSLAYIDQKESED